ncbi:MAG TPA: alpha-1,4-glucan--maltose-1-phosphate maltosyltransferase [Bryobacteraceae bacterium]|nr:alpha-1,4-glucan--maltose-1-phosphate maltosyltransferase [Bryobacteraceae bacterium]
MTTVAEEAGLQKKQRSARHRVVIESIRPQIECGRFPVKRVIGEAIAVEADMFADGHDWIHCRLLYREELESEWHYAEMKPLGNDRWRGEFRVSNLGRYRYTLEGWVDRYGTWHSDLAKRIAAGQDVQIDLLIGAALVDEVAVRAVGEDADRLKEWVLAIRTERDSEQLKAIALREDLGSIVNRYPNPEFITRHEHELVAIVDRKKACFSTWYELFPRSCASEPGRHGTFRDAEERLPYIASMGFDVLYLPPIHPVGRTFRKGKNNAAIAGADDVGSPWAIGAREGGHKSVHPELGTLEDFESLILKSSEVGLELALDIAFQCTPDHPYVSEHPEWFRQRPDGTIQYAENPPKKYQDIYPLDFETAEWQSLWQELKSVLLYWIDRGVRIFRVDNPHTKSFAFWEWAITEIKDQYPDVLFLAEAFTRPHVMYRLAKLGFSQSYTYFTWRNTKHELTEYFTELTQTELREYFRPCLWPNTPDILSEFLQVGKRPAFMIRLVLAATLGANYGIYGPAFELCESVAREPGSEEYLNSEKYEIRRWDVKAEWSLKDFIARVNRIRRENPALQSDRTFRFEQTDNPALLCYSKITEDLSNIIVVVVNLDAFHTQSGWVTLDLKALGVDPDRQFQVQDLLGGGRYLWQGARNYVELTPQSMPAHILRVRKWVRTESDFDYYV